MITPVNPKQVLMRFLTRRCGGSPTDAVPTSYALTSTPTQPGVQIGTEIFTSTCIALFTPSTSLVDPTNKAQLQALSDKYTLDYLNWRQTQFDTTYVGITAIVPTGITSFIEFDYTSDSCKTRASTAPDFNPVQELGHWDGMADTDCPDVDSAHVSDKTPCLEYFGPSVPTQTAGMTTLNKYLLCKEDGRYVSKFEGTVTYPCTCGTPVSCTPSICISGCSKPISGASITIKSGSTVIALCPSTDAGGCCAFPGVSSGTYTVIINIVSLGTFSFTGVVLVCGVTTPINIGSPPTGYVCCTGFPPLPDVLFLTVCGTTVTCTWDGSGWLGIGLFSSSDVALIHGNTTCCLPVWDGASVQTESIPIQFLISCPTGTISAASFNVAIRVCITWNNITSTCAFMPVATSLEVICNLCNDPGGCEQTFVNNLTLSGIATSPSVSTTGTMVSGFTGTPGIFGPCTVLSPCAGDPITMTN